MARPNFPDSTIEFRSHELVNPSIEFAVGFAWAVRKEFRPTLGLEWLPKVEKGAQRHRWVQTPNYSASPGEIYYRSPLAYLDPWSAALPHVDYAIQIRDASPAIGASPGFVAGVLLDFRSGVAVERDHWECTQGEFVEALRTGSGRPMLAVEG